MIVEEPGSEVARAALYIFDCTQEDLSRTTFDRRRRLATFYLPHLADRADYVQFFCVANTPSPGITPHGVNPEAFCPDPSLRVIAFQIGISADFYRRPSYFYLFARAEAFLRHCASHEVEGVVVEWESWASQARLIRKPGDADIWLVDEVSHTRCLVMERQQSSDEDAPMAIMIYDFAPMPVLRYDSATRARRGKWEYFMEPTARKDQTMWRDGVVRTNLPFRKVNTGFVAHPIDVPDDTKEHALTGNFYLTCNNAYASICGLHISTRLADFGPAIGVSFNSELVAQSPVSIFNFLKLLNELYYPWCSVYKRDSVYNSCLLS